MDKIIRSMDVPEVIPDVTKVTLTSDIAVLVENYTSVTEYEPEQIRIKLKKKTLTISGVDLCIQYLTDTNLSIHGKIFSVSFM